MQIDAADERFHPRNDDPHWNESAWFGLTVPEREASAYVYFYHRPNMNLSAGGVKVWDATGASEYDCLGYDWDRTQALPPEAEMFDFTLGNGLSVHMVEPFTTFEIRHRGAFEADLRWQRLTAPYAFGLNAGLEGWTTETEGYTTGHYQQFGRITGTIVIGDDTIEVDTTAIRDRSWGPRRAVAARRAELMWCAASAENAFSVYSVSPHDRDSDPILGTTDQVAFGHYTRDGEGAYITGGTSRVLERGADGRPLRMVLDAEDALGRRLHAEGVAVNALVWSVYDRTYQLPCTTWWEFDGVRATGEDWSCMPTEQARRLLRTSRAGSPTMGGHRPRAQRSAAI
jgi:hypothetical protein